MSDVTFIDVDLTTFCRLGDLGLEVVGQRVLPGRSELACRVVDADDCCHGCGCQGVPRDTVERRLADAPFGWRATTLVVRVRRYRCAGCGRVWRQDMSKAAEPRSKLSRNGLRWALEGLVCQHLTVARVADGLGVSWDTANDAVLAEGERMLIADPARFDHVLAIGVDEHVWRHTRGGDKYVTVIIDLTPARAGSGPARLLDMVAGRSKRVFAEWLQARPQGWRDQVEIVAMDGFVGFKTAAAEQLPDAVEVMDPFHVVQLAGDALDRCRQRVQQESLGHRGRVGDPLYNMRRTLHTGEGLLRSEQRDKLDALFVSDAHAAVEVTWAVYQRVVAAYRDTDKSAGRETLRALIDAISVSVPAGLDEARTLGRTLKRRADDILAYFDQPGSSNGPTEALNGRLEHLRGSALGFRNLTNDITRSLPETGEFKPALHP